MLKKIESIILSWVIIIAVCSCSIKDEGKMENEGEKKNVENVSDEEASWLNTELSLPDGVEFVNSLNYLLDGTLRIATAGQDAAVWDSQNEGGGWEKPDADMSLTSDYGYHYSSEGMLYVYDDEKLVLSPADGSEMKTISINDGEQFISTAISNNILAVLVQNMNSMQLHVEIYDLQTMEYRSLDDLELSEYLSNSQSDVGNVALNSTGEILYIAIDGKGIGRYDLKRNQYSYLIEQDLFQNLTNSEQKEGLNHEAEICTGFAVDDTEKKIVLCMLNMIKNQSKLYLCEWGIPEDKERASKDKLRVYSLKKHGEIQQAVSLFQEKCPELEVTFEVGYTGEDGVELSDAIRTLNTELMSGNGPDILVLDGLPADSYIEKGILEDITSIVDQEKENIFYNIISAYNKKESIYQIPTTFSVPIILGDAEVIDAKNRKELMDILEKKAVTGLPFITPENFAETAVDLFITSDILEGTIDEAKLSDFYRDLKQIAKQSFPDNEIDTSEEFSRMTYWAEEYPYIGFNPEMDIFLGNAQVGIDKISSFETYMEVLSVCSEKDLSYQYLNREKGNYFIAEAVLGINCTGKYRDDAKQFLRYYLSGEAQSAMSYTGFSIIRDMMKDSKYVSENGEFVGSKTRDENLDKGLNLYKVTPSKLQGLIDFFEGLNTPVKDDAVVLQKVMEQADACLFEGKDPESSARDACSEINLYLNE